MDAPDEERTPEKMTTLPRIPSLRPFLAVGDALDGAVVYRETRVEIMGLENVEATYSLRLPGLSTDTTVAGKGWAVLPPRATPAEEGTAATTAADMAWEALVRNLRTLKAMFAEVEVDDLFEELNR